MARAADLAVRLGDFVATKIRWGEKSDAIRELAKELSLGLDSFVFVDDNPVECEAIKQRLDRKDKLTLIDVREESEFAKDHLPTAIHLGKGIIERDIETRVPDINAPLVLYCGGGFRSALAADNLQKMGYTNVLSMDGGIREWREKNFPLTKD